MKKNILIILGIFILGIFASIFANQILWPYFVERSLFYQYGLEQSPVYVTERTEVTIQENVALKNAIERVEKAIVGLTTETKDDILKGSGLILTSDGLVVTLARLVPQGADFMFFVEGEPVSFQILKRDLTKDLALIKLEANNLPTVGFADYGKLKLGERVFLVGTAYGVKDYKKTANEGVITYLDDVFFQTNIYEGQYLNGSPLFNIEGEALGLSSVDPWGSRVSAIPITTIKDFAGF